MYYTISVTLGKGDAYADAWGTLTEGMIPATLDEKMLDGFIMTDIPARTGNWGGIMHLITQYANFGDDLNGVVLDPDGSASPADLAANRLAFFKNLSGGGVTARNFDICRYASIMWDQQVFWNRTGALRGAKWTDIKPPIIK